MALTLSGCSRLIGILRMGISRNAGLLRSAGAGMSIFPPVAARNYSPWRLFAGLCRLAALTACARRRSFPAGRQMIESSKDSVRLFVGSKGGSMHQGQAMRIGNWNDGSNEVKPLLRSASRPVGAALASADICTASAMDAARPLAFMAHPGLCQLPAHGCSGALSWSIHCLLGQEALACRNRIELLNMAGTAPIAQLHAPTPRSSRGYPYASVRARARFSTVSAAQSP